MSHVHILGCAFDIGFILPHFLCHYCICILYCLFPFLWAVDINYKLDHLNKHSPESENQI